MTLIFVTLATGDGGQGGSRISSGKSELSLVETQILTDMKGSAFASKCYPKTRHTDGGSRGSLGEKGTAVGSKLRQDSACGAQKCSWI